jgi:hypothetical protein
MSRPINIIPRRVMGCLLLAGMLVSGCSAGTVTPVIALPPTITDTLTPNPTETPTTVPTNTATILPTATLPPELPSQLGSLLEDSKFTFYDGFDSRSTEDWKYSSCQKVKDGELEYACAGNNLLSRNYVFYEGEGILVDFMKVKPSDDYKFGISFYNSNWSSPLIWQSFGITDSLNLGSRLTITRLSAAMADVGIITLEPEVWYRMALAIDRNGRILVMTWERDNPTREPWKYRNTLGGDWSGESWIFQVFNELPVKLRFDNFFQLSFSKIK